MNLVVLILVCALILIAAYRKETYIATSTVDQNGYRVLGGFDDSATAADRLAKINQKNQLLIQYLLDKYRDPMSHGYLLATRLKKRYQSDRLEENDPVDISNTSFTENKGDKIALCLREKVTGKNRLHGDDILEFVDLHELAHIASQGYGHENEFWENFAFLLKEAFNAGIHTPTDYSKWPIEYCGLSVSYNPLFNN